MAREFPGNTSPASGSKGSARSSTTKMGSFLGTLTHGKEYGQTTANTAGGSGSGSDSDDKAGPSLAATPGKEYRQVKA